MAKALIFVGAPNTGKSRRVMEIVEQIGEENTVFIYGKTLTIPNHSPFIFSSINEKTKLVVIDDCPKNFEWNFIFDKITMIDGEIKVKFWVNARGEYPKEVIVDQIILTTNSFPIEKYKDLSFGYRAEVIQFPLSSIENPVTNI